MAGGWILLLAGLFLLFWLLGGWNSALVKLQSAKSQ